MPAIENIARKARSYSFAMMLIYLSYGLDNLFYAASI